MNHYFSSHHCRSLYNVHMFPLSMMFGLCAFFLAVAAALQIQLEDIAKKTPVIKGMPETEMLLASSEI